MAGENVIPSAKFVGEPVLQALVVGVFWRGGKIEMMSTYGDSPMPQRPPELRDKIIHARMAIGDSILMGSDTPPDRHKPAQGFSVSLSVKEPADAERVFQDLSHKGKVEMPIQKTFWSVRFGMLVDQFGIPWMVNCDQVT